MGGNSRTGIPWADLPKELLEMIAKCLHTETDILRFRAVCNSWRSSTPPFKKFPSTPLPLPFPLAAGATSHPYHRGAFFYLTERIVYRVELPDGSKQPNFWLVKVERLRDGKLRILNPVSNDQINITPEIQMPKVLNTLDFRVSEVSKAYALRYVNNSNPNLDDEYKYAKKVVVTASIENDEYVVMAIDKSNKLWYINSGDETWTMVPDNGGSNNYVDVVNYKGQLYGIDERGGTWVFNSMFEATKIAYNILHRASKRHLVELYNGELHLVEEVKDERISTSYIISECQCRFNWLKRTFVREMAVEMKICRLNKQEREWVEAKTLNDWIVFVGDDCSFSFSANEFEGCNGTRVFYTDRYICSETEVNLHCYKYLEGYHSNSSKNIAKVDDLVDSSNFNLGGLFGHNTGVCDFETGKAGSLLRFLEYADIFWPPPSWLSRT